MVQSTVHSSKMSALEGLNLLPFIRRRVEEGATHKTLCEELQSRFRGVRGISVRSIKRFCAIHGLHSTSRLSNKALDVLVAFGIGMVGPTYGRKLMTGFLSSQGFKVSEKRVGCSLKRVNPLHHTWRQNTSRRLLNPVPYRAAYFGEKLHIDQNENIVMFGVTHVCAVDGFSGKIVGFISLPVKNNGIILYREIVATYGLWDQVRVDKGKEWYLSLFVNNTLSALRYCTSKHPHLQTTSKQNHTVERLWVEVNKRVNYPLKEVLNGMVRDGSLRLEDPLHQFSCSWLTLHVSSVGAQLFVSSWNAHPIPGGRKRCMKRGIPNTLMNQDNRAKKIDSRLLPTLSQAVSQYAGRLSDPCQFGTDPLELYAAKKDIRLQSFCSKYNFKALFCDVSNGCGSSFSSAFKYFVDVTYRLSHS